MSKFHLNEPSWARRRGRVECSQFATHGVSALTWRVLIALGIFYVLALGRGVELYLTPYLRNPRSVTEVVAVELNAAGGISLALGY